MLPLMAYGHSSGLPPWEALVMIAEKRKLVFSFLMLPLTMCTIAKSLQRPCNSVVTITRGSVVGHCSYNIPPATFFVGHSCRDFLLIQPPLTSLLVHVCRDAEVLSLFAAIINKLKERMAKEVPTIFEAVFQVTLQMITKNFEVCNIPES